MDILLARLLHVGLGAFWVGTALYNAIFLGPVLKEMGPEAAKIGAALMRRRLMLVMPIAALLTLLSGFWLYWRVSGGFDPGFMGSRQGQMLGAGGLAAVAAFVLGFTIVRPSMMKAGALGQRAVQAAGTERDALLAQAQPLRARADLAGTIVSWLLGLALVAMAVARYV